MNCEQFDQIVMHLLYGEADEDQSAEAKRHTDRCERCASSFDNLRRTRKAAMMPMVQAPSDFENHIVDVARQAQQEIPWPRRIGRWVSWAGGHAMRPQLAMAALLLLMIGSSLLLIRGRPGSESVGVVRVTEQGVPEREGVPQVVTPDVTQLPPRAVVDAQRRGMANAKAGGEGSGTHLPRKTAKFARGQYPKATGSIDEVKFNGLQSPPDNRASEPKPTAAASSPAADGYTKAMLMYEAGDYANAYRAFDMIDAKGGPQAPSAALYAAKAVRASSGCTNALPRFESVSARFRSSGVRIQAKWEIATCARITGDLTRARIIYRELSRNPSLRERAERELARISGGPSKTQHQRRAAAPPAPSSSSSTKGTNRKNPDDETLQEF